MDHILCIELAAEILEITENENTRYSYIQILCYWKSLLNEVQILLYFMGENIICGPKYIQNHKSSTPITLFQKEIGCLATLKHVGSR